MTLTIDGLALPGDAQRRPICGVVVVAYAAGLSFPEAWAIMAKGRGKSWRGKTHERDRLAILQALGVKVSTMLHDYTTLNALAKRLDPAGTYIVRTSGHVQIVHAGHILDQGGWRPVSPKDWACRKYVTSVYRIDGRAA